MRLIAEMVGCHIDTIFRIRRADNMPSPDLAVRLEKALKIDRRRWLWPDEFGDPWKVFYDRYKKKA